MAEDYEPKRAAQWLVLLYQFPKQPGSLRMKIWRRLQRVGAVAVKNSAYVLPLNEHTREDFEWILKEITSGGAEGALLEASFIDGLEDKQLRSLFDDARNEDYAELANEVRQARETLPPTLVHPDERQLEFGQQLMRFRKRFKEIESVDFFGANGREAAEGMIASLAYAIAGASERPDEEQAQMHEAELMGLSGKIWVTRKNVHVDRIASAWLIKRWIDENAKFKFTPTKNYQRQENEFRFDMFEAEFTHEGDQCTFEVLLARAGIDDMALRKIGEIIHDIDLKDAKFNHDETLGIEHLLAGLAANVDTDEERLIQGSAIFDNLYKYFAGAKA